MEIMKIRKEIRWMTILIFMVLGVACLYKWSFGPSEMLHDFKYVAYYRDGGSETHEIDSISYYRQELLRGGWKFVYCQYVNGQNEYFTDYVTRYHLYTIRTYKNETAHYHHYWLIARLMLGAFVLNIIVFVSTFVHCRRQKEILR